MAKLENSFENVRNYLLDKNEKNSEKVINRESFFQLLRENGEEMKEDEIQEILKVLRGDGNYKNLPENLSFQYLFEELLKFEFIEKEEENKIN